MEEVYSLPITETVRIDPDRLVELCTSIGETATEHLLMQSIERLGREMQRLNELITGSQFEAVAAQIDVLQEIARYIGMTTLDRALTDASMCLDQQDAISLGAVLARLNRIADRSLFALWEMQDLHG